MIKEMPKNEGSKGQLVGRNSSGPTKKDAPKEQPPTYAELNISYKDASRCQQIAENNKEIQNRIAEYKLRVIRKIGQWSLELERQHGNQHTKSASDQAGQKHTKGEMLEKAGITRGQVIRKETIASLPEEAFEKHIAEVKLL